MKNRFPHLTSPLKIHDVILKNRTCTPECTPHFLNGSEDYPGEAFTKFYCDLARSGAAYINIGLWTEANLSGPNCGIPGDAAHMPLFDRNSPGVQNKICQLAQAVHLYGSKISVYLRPQDLEWPEGYSYAGTEGGGLDFLQHPIPSTVPATPEMIDDLIDRLVELLALYRGWGFDMCSLPLEYFLFPHGRTDEYGDFPIGNRVRLMRRLCEKIKAELGENFLIEAIVYGESHTAMGGINAESPGGSYSTEDLIEAAREMEGLVDIYTLRENGLTKGTPTCYNFEKGRHPEMLEYGRKLKQSGVRAVVALNGGFQDPEELENILASGAADMICMARGYFAEPEYMKKIQEGRPEDITPCVWCSKCHGSGDGSTPWVDVCTVNPLLGISHLAKDVALPATASKKVAVIGGGPAGMKAAQVAAQRGHKVTLYEMRDHLGGQTDYADYFKFKWNIRDYRDWLIAQIRKAGVSVVLNCRPTPEEIAAENYDAVIAATGAAAKLPDIPGIADAEGRVMPYVMSSTDVYGKAGRVGSRVVVIGGSEVGTEIGIYFAQAGHEVTVLTRGDSIAHDAWKLHYITMSWDKVNPNNPFDMIGAEWEKYPNFHGIVRASTSHVEEGGVYYTDEEGSEHRVECDAIVACGGTTPRQDEALRYASCADQFFVIGDAEGPGGAIYKCTRSAWQSASQI